MLTFELTNRRHPDVLRLAMSTLPDQEGLAFIRDTLKASGFDTGNFGMAYHCYEYWMEDTKKNHPETSLPQGDEWELWSPEVRYGGLTTGDRAIVAKLHLLSESTLTWDVELRSYAVNPIHYGFDEFSPIVTLFGVRPRSLTAAINFLKEHTLKP